MCAQLYIQRAAQPDTWVMSGAPAATAIWLSRDTPINYSDGSTDTLPANTPAAVTGGGTSFDRTHDVYVPYTVKGSGVLSIIKESLLPTLTDDYAPLARVELHGIKPYQPEPYLSAGGLGGSGSSTQTIVSALPAKALPLWTGSTNASPPSGWADIAFDDSAWASAVVATQLGTGIRAPMTGTSPLWYAASPQVLNVYCALRQSFHLPAGTISSATLTGKTDDSGDIYVNGTLLWTDTTPDVQAQSSVSVSPSLLVGGGTNVIASLGKDNTGTGSHSTAPSDLAADASWVCYQLDVTYSGSGAAGATEGDLLYFHNGVWADLGIGPSGDVLRSDGTDPGWATPGGGSGLGTVTSVQVAVPAPLAASGGPITSSGTITLSWSGGQTQNRVLASPDGSSGAVSLRALVGNDIPVDASTIVSSAGTIKGNYQAGSGISISGNTISATGSGGTVTSVALTVPGIFSLSGSPIVSSGTLAISLASQSAATVFAGPASGSAAAPTFRALQGSDLPAGSTAGGNTHAHSHFH